MNDDQTAKIAAGRGFIAALDQSGGSAPKALALYGIPEGAWTNDEEMFDLIHQMRSRITTSPAFAGDRILGAILFEQTMDRQIDGMDAADFLWDVKQVVPFLKVDSGLDERSDGVQLMKPMLGLADLLERAKARNVFGTKMRSVIHEANTAGVRAIVDQQFAAGGQILAADLMPILEPEISIDSPSKREAEEMLLTELRAGLDELDDGQQVMFKVTLPEEPNFFIDLVQHPKVLKVVALSGGYDQTTANSRLVVNHGVVASFSRAFTEGLSVDQTDDEFNEVLDRSVAAIHQASLT